ncbi:MAG: Stk1 family PASTA domain-containing Ser/Thr kinase [Candidatus Ancillula sp.]|jgi:serine/threonine-protein kinase|nr:Stk1 family PASTA domain-containing Ser/Thr kinase [Candidatus Ancillula sp.]
MTDNILANRYKMGEEIGHGGMSDVYIGVDERLNRKVAIKVLKQQLSDDPVFLARFRREAQSAASLNNPNIVAVYDSGEEVRKNEVGLDVHLPYIVMEYVEGKTLREILQQEGRLSVKDSSEVVEKVLNALAYSHKNGIIHRDIKPGNVMITNTGEVKVMDFGIARAIVDSGNTMTQSQGVVGTAQYLSPEQARGETVDSRSDLYSVGCLLFELLTGRPPFIGDSPVAIAYQHVRENPPKASSINESVPTIFDVIISKALAKDVDARYGDASQFSADLKAAISGQPISSAIGDSDATQVLTPAQVAAINGADADATQVFGDAFGQDLSDPSEEVDESELDEDARKKRLRIIIIAAGVIGLILVSFLLMWALGVFSSGSKGMVRVPTISKSMDESKACQMIKDVGLECEVVDDDDSVEDAGKYTHQEPSAGTEVERGSKVKVYFSTGPAQGTIPKNIEGKTLDEAKKILKDAGYKVSEGVAQKVDCEDPSTLKDADAKSINVGACETDDNKVAGSKPSLGTTQTKGTAVVLYLASGQANLPALEGKSKDDAKKVVESMNLKFKESGDPIETNSVPEGMVARQNPPPGLTPIKGEITVQYAKSAKTKIPADIVGKDEASAKAELVVLGLNVIVTGTKPTNDQSMDGKVAEVQPGAGSDTDKGATVALVIWKYTPPATPTTPTGTCSTPNYTSQSTCEANGGTWTSNNR